MPLARKFRLYAVTIHDKTSREVHIPEHEIGVLKAAWRGAQITALPTNDVREIVTEPTAAYQSLKNRYKPEAVFQYFPGPERLEQDMATAADKTDAWLLQVEAYNASEDKRIRDLAKSERERIAAEEAAKAKTEEAKAKNGKAA
jgi:hypothetical protein